eukprot:snap_masked-scaffold_2-processed-gene-3.2-mRNA-1 protein AED:1.00 eAED:1.00 QI:0/0/0/0/1/1/2/0/64
MKELLIKRKSILPVTALQSMDLNGSLVLVCGFGSQLRVYEHKTGRVLAEVDVSLFIRRRRNPPY